MTRIQGFIEYGNEAGIPTHLEERFATVERIRPVATFDWSGFSGAEPAHGEPVVSGAGAPCWWWGLRHHQDLTSILNLNPVRFD